MEALNDYRIDSICQNMYYVANFISQQEEQTILDKVCPHTVKQFNSTDQTRIPANRWITLSKRRLQAIPTQLSANNTLLAARLPEWLTSPVIKRLEQLNIFDGSPHGINHCLVNEYEPGQGIMPHEDGAAYYPIVATVSLGGTIVLDVTSKPGSNHTAHAMRIVQEPRSLLITSDSAYADLLHGITAVDQDVDLNQLTVANWSLLGNPGLIEQNGGCNDRVTRISLTLRDVLKVSTAGSKLFGRPKS